VAKTKTSAESREWDDISIGDQVKHAKWGVGTVLFRSGMGDDAKAIVVFPEEGQKKLMLCHAKLKKVASAPKSSAKPKPAPAVKIADPDEPEELDMADADITIDGVEEVLAGDGDEEEPEADGVKKRGGDDE
jgi:hypothetical protein